MGDDYHNAHPLIRQFREFYVEAMRLRDLARNALPLAYAIHGSTTPRVETGVAMGAGGTASASGSAAVATLEENDSTSTKAVHRSAGDIAGVARRSQVPEPAAGLVWQQMALYLEQRTYEAHRASGVASYEVQRELVYLMAAMADEIFLHLDWNGKRYWLNHLMEERLFHTHFAGQEIFRRIDRVLQRQDYAADDLAAIYLMMLALRFKGQYWRTEDGMIIERYRQNLLERLLRSAPELARDTGSMFPEAYEHTVTEGAPVRLPAPVACGVSWVALVVLLWLVISSGVWWHLRQGLDVTIEQTSDSLDAARTKLENSRSLEISTPPMLLPAQPEPAQVQANMPPDVQPGVQTVAPPGVQPRVEPDAQSKIQLKPGRQD